MVLCLLCVQADQKFQSYSECRPHTSKGVSELGIIKISISPLSSPQKVNTLDEQRRRRFDAHRLTLRSFFTISLRYIAQSFIFPAPRLPLTRPLTNSPRPQRQALQLQRRRFNITPECDNTNDDTNDVCDIVAISFYVAESAAVGTTVLVSL